MNFKFMTNHLQIMIVWMWLETGKELEYGGALFVRNILPYNNGFSSDRIDSHVARPFLNLELQLNEIIEQD